ncbi:hypothetical protein [Phenylobacterium sp.]|jgi:uncharacterized membrane-anchored protein|uniref:COG4705 family protein n=1 Tax=Phenylobacterium sp. TaxID=1871053 RepID=UPI002F3F8747
MMRPDMQDVIIKAPAVTLGFWVIKVLATTLGETGGDTLSMSLKLGYLISTAIFLTILIALVAAQIAAKRFRPLLYWATIIASTTAGTTIADFADRSLGIGYAGGALILLTCVLASLAAWRWTLGAVAADTVSTPGAEAFYWTTITFSQTLGTALGDWAADTRGLGYMGAAILFGALLLAVAGLYFWTRPNRVTLFWAAFILTRPLGAAVGDFLDKPLDHGGLALSRPIASAVLAVVIGASILILPQRAGRHPTAAPAA